MTAYFVEVVLPVPLEVDRDDVEASLTELLDGTGEVIGAGWGDGRAHLDVEMLRSVAADHVEALVLEALRASGVRAARFRIDAARWFDYTRDR